MQKLEIDITIAGKNVSLQLRGKERMKGVTIGDTLAYRFYDGEYQGMPLLFAEPKGPVASPRNLALTADKISASMGLPVVYLLPSAPAYQRQRLIDRDVYFVVSAKYAHLPMLVANERIRHKKAAKVLSPVAQYLLLYHLQVESLEGLARRESSYTSTVGGLNCGNRRNRYLPTLLNKRFTVTVWTRKKSFLCAASMPLPIIRASIPTRSVWS